MDKERNKRKQYELNWCKTEAIKNGARGRVDKAVGAVKELGFSMKSVLIVGAHHGYEAERYREHGVKDILCLDIADGFIKDCKEMGFKGVVTAIEDWEPKRKFDGVHVSHTLEHTFDQSKAVEVIKKAAKSWCFVEVPITPSGKGTAVDLSVITHKDVIKKLFSPWKKKKLKDKNRSFTAVFYPEAKW